jgi:hypothetical protein
MTCQMFLEDNTASGCRMQALQRKKKPRLRLPWLVAQSRQDLAI